ncbi:MAG: DUF3267 domain-containing protein [Anaerolineae bacterium]|nr:DUF3267 domain-containing protein [Anaerolineae bacterium]
MLDPSTQPITALPDGYREVRYLSVNQRGMLVWLNLMSLIPLVISAMLIFGLGQVYHEELGAPLVIGELPFTLPSWLGLILALLVLPLHELIHGLAIQQCGHRPRYGVKLLVLFATSDGAYFRRGEFIRIALAPLVCISAAGTIFILFLPADLGHWIALAVTLNAAGAIGDLWMTAVVLRYDSMILVRDEEDSMRIFARGQT